MQNNLKINDKETDTQKPTSENRNEREEKLKEIKENGSGFLVKDEKYKIELISIIGEIEGHEVLGSNSKTTKYEHLLPRLAEIENDDSVDGVLVLLNTMGGDVEAGLAIAEMLSSIQKPTVSLVLGGSHSIGVPIAVSTDYSFIVESGTMVIHPVRLTGMVIGAPSTYEYFQSIQDRITGFVVKHSKIKKHRFEKLMLETKVLTKDVGSILVGEMAIKEGLIDEVGGIHEALQKLHQLIDDNLAI